jgi:hypothetical protein
MSATDAIPSTLTHALESLRRLSDLGTETDFPRPVAPISAPASVLAPTTPAGAGTSADGSSAVVITTRLEAKVRDVTELNDRIMAQNIALMSDLEAAQRMVREMRAAKDALAVQLKRAMLAKE